MYMYLFGNFFIYFFVNLPESNLGKIEMLLILKLFLRDAYMCLVYGSIKTW